MKWLKKILKNQSSLVALIGSLIVFIAAVYTGINNIYIAKIPIKATQTAEMERALATAYYETAISLTPMTPTKTPFGPIPLQIVRLSKCYTRVIPEEYNPETQLHEILKIYFEKLDSGSMDNWPYGPDLYSLLDENVNGGAINIEFIVRHLAIKDDETVFLNGRGIVSIIPQDYLEKVNVIVGACGGGPPYPIQKYSPIYLARENSKIIIKTIQSDNLDPRFLEPGGTEVIQVPITCNDPGVYYLQFNFPYTYLDYSGELTIKLEPIVCPIEISLWGIYDSDFEYIATYYLKNGKYEKTP